MTVRYERRIRKGSRVIVSRLKPGSDLLRSLRDIASKEGIEGGVILSRSAF